MKLNKVIDQIRNDFKGAYECEYCGDVQVDRGLNSYDDLNYHQNVIPHKKCLECGLSTIFGVKVGQVWRQKRGGDIICVVSINPTTQEAFMCGVVDAVMPIFTYQYLTQNFKLLEGWGDKKG